MQTNSKHCHSLSVHTRHGISAFLMAGLLGLLFLTPSQATELPETESTETGKSKQQFRIVDDSGNPVSGATVRLFRQTQTFRELVKHELLFETKSDQDGSFSLPDGKQVANARDTNRGFSATWVTVPATKEKPERTWLLGTSAGAFSPYMEFIFALGTDPKTLQDLKQGVQSTVKLPVTYTLHDRATLIRVVDHDSSPAAGIRVTPIRLVWLSKGKGKRPIFVPPELRESLSQVTDADGKVTFSTIARPEFTELEMESRQHGIQRTFTNNNSIEKVLDKDLMLFPTGSVTGQVKATTPAGEKFLKGRKLLFKSEAGHSGVRPPRGRPITMHGYAEVTVDGHGRFEIPAMLNGRMTLYDRLERDAATRIMFVSPMIIRPGQAAQVEGKVISTVLVRGILRKRGTGEGVPRAAIKISHGIQAGLSRQLGAYAQTDKDGHFEARVFPGVIGYSPLTVIPGHVPVYKWERPKVPVARIPRLPYGKRVAIPDDVTEFQLPPLELVPSLTLAGRLLDADGDPMPKTGVYAFPVAGQTNCDFARTNSDGEFTMDRVPSTHPPKFFKAGPQFKTKEVTIVSREPLVLRMKPE